MREVVSSLFDVPSIKRTSSFKMKKCDICGKDRECQDRDHGDGIFHVCQECIKLEIKMKEGEVINIIVEDKFFHFEVKDGELVQQEY